MNTKISEVRSKDHFQIIKSNHQMISTLITFQTTDNPQECGLCDYLNQLSQPLLNIYFQLKNLFTNNLKCQVLGCIIAQSTVLIVRNYLLLSLDSGNHNKMISGCFSYKGHVDRTFHNIIYSNPAILLHTLGNSGKKHPFNRHFKQLISLCQNQ